MKVYKILLIGYNIKYYSNYSAVTDDEEEQ